MPRESDAAAQEQLRLRLERELGGMTARLDEELGDASTAAELLARESPAA